jgi:hypothetical protein
VDSRAIAIWNQLSRAEYSLDFEVSVTPQNLAAMNVATLFPISGMPWPSFNSTPSRPYYFPRKMTEKFSTGDSGEAEGWTCQFEAISHPPPAGGI